MGLFDAWRPQELPIASEGSRCAEANAAAAGVHKPAKLLEPLAPFSPSGSIMLTPASSLMRLMEVSVPALGSGFMGFVARWSWVSYLWAFAAPAKGKPLRLSTHASQLAGRRKGLLSEQLGIAIGLSVMERQLKLSDPSAFVTAIDADAAIAAGKAGRFDLDMRAKGGIRPDYFLIRERPGGPAEIHALECKGQSSRLSSSKLATAARQLQGVGVARAGGFYPPPGVVVATSFSEEEVLTEAFDPDGDEIWSGWIPPSEGEDRPSVERSGGRDLVTDVPRFRRLLMDIHEATLLEIGQSSLGEDSEQVGLVETPLGVFRGSSYEVPISPGVEARAFLGVERGVFDAVASRERESIAAARAAWAASVRRRSPAEPADSAQAGREQIPERDLVVVDEEGLESYAVDEKGILLHLLIRPRGSVRMPA